MLSAKSSAPPALPGLRARAFTLIELLVVISIIALLIAILLPTLRAARETARTMACLSNNRQIVLGFVSYAQDFDVLPRGDAQLFAARPIPYIILADVIRDLESRGVVADDEGSVWKCPSYELPLRGKLNAASVKDDVNFTRLDTYGSTMVVTGLIQRKSDPAPGTPFPGYLGKRSPNTLDDQVGPVVGDFFAYWPSLPAAQRDWYSIHGSGNPVQIGTPALPILGVRNPTGGNMTYSDGSGAFARTEDIIANMQDGGVPVNNGWYNWSTLRYGFIEPK